MAISPQIASLRSSGTYRFEFDKSQTVSIPAEQIRMIVGFSKKGPFNTPIYVSDTGFFSDVYGSIDRTLERKGSYFHRTCLAALERGPILALNLLRLNNDDSEGNADKIEDVVFSTSATQINDTKSSDLFAGFFNRDKFWFPDTEAFIKNVTSSGNKLFNLTNIDKKPLTVIVKRADFISGFDITVKEWYGISNIPEFLHKDDYISDFMIDVIVIEGDFGPKSTDTTPYERLASDPLFASYFDKSRGIKRKVSVADSTDTSLEAFLNLPEVNHIATYTGCLIPDFIDLNSNNLFIETIINTETSKTGLFCSINKEAYDSGELLSGVDGGLDLIGHNLEWEQPTTIDFLSYKETIKANLDYAKKSVTLKAINDCTGLNPVLASSGNLLISVDSSTNATFYNIVAQEEFRENELSPRILGSYLQADSGEFVPVITKQVTATTALIEVSVVGGITETSFDTALSGNDLKYVNYTDIDFLVDDLVAAPADSIIAAYSNDMYTSVEQGTITDGDKMIWDADGSGDPQAAEVLYIDSTITTFDSIVYGGLYLSGAITDTNYLIPVAKIEGYEDSSFVTQGTFNFSEVFFDNTDTPAATDTLVIQTLKGALNSTIPATATSLSNVIEVHSDYANKLAVGKYIVADDGGTTGPSRLTRIVRISQNATTLTVTTVGKVLFKTVNAVPSVEVYSKIGDWVDYYTLFSLNGFTYTSYHLPDGSMEQQNNILYDTISGTKLYKALIDKDNITFRYIVDSFGLGIESGSKAVLCNLAKTRQNAFAILNAPAIKDFKESTDPSFLDAQGLLDTKMISEGGDLTKNPKVVYTLPGVEQGSNYAGFYIPYVLVRDRGKNLAIPPAGYVSNNFVEKYTSSVPWAIVAGPRRGVVGGRGLVGLEYNLSKEDRDWIEPFGLNPIIFQSGTGIVIFGNKTAQQNIKSALSSIHVREVLIYIQDGIAAILKNFIFEFNTAQTRLEIKTLADNFMRQIQADNGVYDFRNIMDETNNTPDVIDKNIGILDTYVEPVKGLEILVHRTTVLKTGAISTGEFI